MTTPNAQLPTPKAITVARLRVLWELGVGRWELTALSVILLSGSALFFTNLDTSSIWDANEAFYVETPREMIERGDYVVPYFNYEPRLNKPVLSYWIVAGLYHAFGGSVAVQRVGIAIGGLVIVACAFCLGWAAADRRPAPEAPVMAALLAAAGLAVDPRLVMFSRRIFIDVWITAFMALTLTFFVLAERLPYRRRLFLTLMYTATGLGVLTKGPIAVLLPALVFALYLALRREAPRLRDMMIPAGALIVVAIVLPWHAALYYREGWTPIASFLLSENVGRYTSGIGFQSPRGPLFYLPVVFADGFPLSLFLIPAAVLWWRDRRAAGPREHVARRTSHVARSTSHVARRTSHAARPHLLWLWIIVIVVFFSFSHDKQDLYILPIVPAVAALGAAAIVRRDEIPTIVRGTVAVLGIVLAVCGAAVVYVFQVMRPVYALEGAPLVGVVAAAGGVVTLALALQRRVAGGLAIALATLLIVNWLLVVRILSDLEQHKPVPILSELLRPRISPQDGLSTLNVALPSLVYYLQRRVDVHYAPEPFVADALDNRRMFGVLSEADYERLRREIGPRSCVVARVPAFEMKLKQVLGRAARSNLVLITNRCNGR